MHVSKERESTGVSPPPYCDVSNGESSRVMPQAPVALFASSVAAEF